MISEQGFSFSHFFQIYLTFPLIQLFFLLLGIMISTIVSRVSASLPLALGISFGFYVIGLFSNVVQSTIARLFSPFRYFDFNLVLASENYRSEEHTSELQSRGHLVCRLPLEKKKKTKAAHCVNC